MNIQEKKEFIKENYHKMSTRKLGKVIGVSGRTVSYHCRNMGLMLTKNKHNVNQSLYKNLNNKNFIYLLGFLWADGYLGYYPNGQSHSTRIETVLSDSEHICGIIDKLDIKYTISKRNRENRQPQQTIFISDSAFSQFLVNNFKFDKKSYISHEHILEKIPENLRVYWFQGYMDGDGFILGEYLNKEKKTRISRGKIEFSSSYDQEWDYISKIIKNLGCDFTIPKYISKKGFKSSKIYMSKVDNCRRFLEWLYEDPSLCLERKYKKYEEFYLKYDKKNIIKGFD